MSEIQIGSVLARRYRVDAKLGEGGMAVVYRAYDLQRQVPVALKLLKPDYAEDTTFIHKFRREARNLQRLQHPNIVRFYEFVEDGALAFMVLDYIDGPTLRNVMRQRGRPLSPGEVLGYLRPICAALNYAHSERVIHCDMKPANVMIDHTGRVFVNDFGIARISESSTVTFSTPGTAAYMAPEQWRGGEDVYPATDVYALGIMLYELLASKQPYTGETAQTKGHNRERLMWEHLHATPQPASQINPHLPLAFDNVLLKCLAKDPAGRYQSAGELLAAFEGACQQASIVEVPVQSRSPEPLQTAAPAGQTSPSQTGTLPLPHTSTGMGQKLVIAGAGAAGLLVVGVGIVVVAFIVALLAFSGRNGPPSSVLTANAVFTPTAVTAPSIQLSTDTPVFLPTDMPLTSAPPPASLATETAMPTLVVPPPTSGSSGKIAVRSNRSGFYEIAIMNPDGTGFRQLTFHQNLSDEPDFSPDGQRIVFERKYGKGDDWEIHIINVDGSNEYSLGKGRLPEWSPDGQWIAFEAPDNQNYWQIWRMRADGASREQLTFDGRDNRAPSWSPDGQRLIMMSEIGANWQLVILDLNTRAQQQITSGSPDKRFPVWSPDGRWIAYNTRKGGNPDQIWKVDITGNKAQQLTTGGQNGRPNWSPDGRFLLYNAQTSSGRWQIVRINSDGSNPVVISPGIGGTGDDEQPDWSPR